MPKVLFVQPTQYGHDGTLCKQRKIYLPGLAFPLLAAYTPPHWDVEVLLEVVDDVDYGADADIVGIGSMGYSIFRGFEIAREFRKRGKTVVMGGYMASMVPDEVLKHADAVVVGDGERSYLKLLADYEAAGTVHGKYEEPVTDLAGLPVPDYGHLVRKPIGTMLPVQAGRGCPHACTFCSIACIYKGRYSARPADDVLNDVARIRELGFRSFYLIDDNIVSNAGYLRELCMRLEPLKMRWASQCSLLLAKNEGLLRAVRRAGGYMMSFGIESISQEGLDQYDKTWLRADEHETLVRRITDAGILVSSEMVVGTDGDTEESIRETFRFVERCRIPIPRFYIITPMPGSPLYGQYKREGRLLTEDYRLYDGARCVFRPKRMSAERLTEMYWWLNRKVFSFGSILKRTLLHPRAYRNPRAYLFAFAVNLHYRRYVMKRVPPNIF